MDPARMTRMEPADVGGLLDRIFRLYLANFPIMIGTLAIVYVPFVGISMFWQRLLQTSPVAALLGALAFLTWTIVFLPLATGAITFLVSEEYMGRRITIGQAYSRAFQRLGSIIGAGFLSGLAIGLGMMCLCVPGFIFMTWFAVVIPAVVLEGAGVSDSLDRSKSLSVDHRMSIFGVLIVLMVLGAFVNGGVMVGSTFLFGGKLGQPQPLRAEVLQHVVGLVLAPLNTIASVIIYYDLRVRKEGFDLEMLSRALSGQPTVVRATPIQPPPQQPPQGPSF